MRAMSVGVREAKINLSKLLKLVQKGKEIILTDRGRPVGKIIPVGKESIPLHERIKILEEAGVIERRHEKGRREIPRPIPVPEGLAQKLLQEDRDNG
jgi:prevent-host-death family protein